MHNPICSHVHGKKWLLSIRMHFGHRFLHGCACMWNEVEDESCDIVPMPALRLQTRSLGLCCLYSPGFAAEYGTPNGSETWSILEKNKKIKSDCHISVVVCVHMVKFVIFYFVQLWKLHFSFACFSNRYKVIAFKIRLLSKVNRIEWKMLFPFHWKMPI